MNNLKEYIVEKLRINKDTKIENKLLVEQFCKYTSLNYTHEGNKTFFLEFEKYLKETKIDLNSVLIPIAKGEEAQWYFENDKKIANDFITGSFLYDTLSNYTKKGREKWGFNAKDDDLEVKIFNTKTYGWLILYKVYDIEHPFFFLIKDKDKDPRFYDSLEKLN